MGVIVGGLGLLGGQVKSGEGIEEAAGGCGDRQGSQVDWGGRHSPQGDQGSRKT